MRGRWLIFLVGLGIGVPGWAQGRPPDLPKLKAAAETGDPQAQFDYARALPASRGAEQLDWLEKDLAPLSADTPIVLFAHVPLWLVYPKWGWGTDDGAKALALVKRFGSVTVLNGHIHQVVQKVEGNITFHTARGTAFPLPAPGAAPKPGPMPVEASRLRSLLGLTTVSYVETSRMLAVVDATLASG